MEDVIYGGDSFYLRAHRKDQVWPTARVFSAEGGPVECWLQPYRFVGIQWKPATLKRKGRAVAVFEADIRRSGQLQGPPIRELTIGPKKSPDWGVPFLLATRVVPL